MTITYTRKIQKCCLKAKAAKEKMKKIKIAIIENFYKEMELITNQQKQDGGKSKNLNTMHRNLVERIYSYSISLKISLILITV